MITLYYAPDNASLIVRILLEELELAYDTVLVDRSTSEQRSEQYLKLNPNGLIPVCVIDDKPVFETAAILLHLADTHNRFNVAPDSERRPEFLKWIFYLSNSLHVDCRMRFYPEKYAGDGDATAFGDVAFQNLNERLAILNDAYRSSASDYLFDDEPTIVDLYLAVCLRWIQLYPVKEKRRIKLDSYPALLAMAKKLEGREKVVEACKKEGIADAFFTRPGYCNPPEGVAL